MKKLIFAAAIAAGMGAFALESANVVGYANKNAESGKFLILGAQFEQVSDGSMSIDGLITGVSETALDDNGLFKTTAAQIQIPNGVGYTTRFYLADGWYEKGNDDWAQKAGWCDEDGLIVADELTPGEAVWLKDPNGDANVMIAGAVPSEKTTTVSCPAEFALRANVYPMPITLNSSSMVVSGAAVVNIDDNGAFKLTAPQIQIPNGVGYTTRWYVADAWYDKGNDEWAQKAGWCDEDGLLVSDIIPVAQGFWTKGVSSAFSLTFSK